MITTLSFVRLHEAAKLPRRPHRWDAGLDLSSVEVWTIGHGETAIVETGVAVAIPPGYVGLVQDRSSMGAAGTTRFGGVIDSGYSGPIRVVLHNTSREPMRVEVGQRIAQLVVVECLIAEPTWVDELPASDRGEGGFGSSG